MAVRPYEDCQFISAQGARELSRSCSASRVRNIVNKLCGLVRDACARGDSHIRVEGPLGPLVQKEMKEAGYATAIEEGRNQRDEIVTYSVISWGE